MSSRRERKRQQEQREANLKWADDYVQTLIEMGHTPEEAWKSFRQIIWAAIQGPAEMERFALRLLTHKLSARK